MLGLGPGADAPDDVFEVLRQIVGRGANVVHSATVMSRLHMRTYSIVAGRSSSKVDFMRRYLLSSKEGVERAARCSNIVDVWSRLSLDSKPQGLISLTECRTFPLDTFPLRLCLHFGVTADISPS